MAKVLDVFKLKSGYSVLICSKIAESSGNLITSIGTFPPGEYEIADGTSCFSESVSAVILKTERDCSHIEERRFA